MKTYHLKDILKKDLLIIELPRVCDYHLYEDMLYVFDNENDKNYRFRGTYTLLGKPDEIKEEDAENLVKAPEPYWDDNLSLKVIGNAKWSYVKPLLSAIETVIFWDVNPLPKPNGESYTQYWNIWREAESRTFDISRTLIFVKQ